jgi:hypothetical protein
MKIIQQNILIEKRKEKKDIKTKKYINIEFLKNEHKKSFQQFNK